MLWYSLIELFFGNARHLRMPAAECFIPWMVPCNSECGPTNRRGRQQEIALLQRLECKKHFKKTILRSSTCFWQFFYLIPGKIETWWWPCHKEDSGNISGLTFCHAFWDRSHRHGPRLGCRCMAWHFTFAIGRGLSGKTAGTKLSRSQHEIFPIWTCLRVKFQFGHNCWT